MVVEGIIPITNGVCVPGGLAKTILGTTTALFGIVAFSILLRLAKINDIENECVDEWIAKQPLRIILENLK